MPQPGMRPPGMSSPLLHRFLKIFFDLLYGSFAWTYDAVSWLVSLGRWKTWIYSTLPELNGRRVLELGHGPGHLQVALRNKGLPGFGLDQSRQMSRIAARRLRAAGVPPLLVRASARRIPFKNNAFDQLVATFPTEYILLADTLVETRRVLKPTGQLVLLPVAWIVSHDLLDSAAAWLFRATGQAREWNPAFGNSLRTAGFEVEEKRIKIRGSEVMLVIGTSF